MKYTKGFSFTVVLGLLVLIGSDLKAQGLDNPDQGLIDRQKKEGIRIVQTGAAFLYITPDSRAGAMGDVGAASEPDVNSQHWNASKYTFIDKKSGASLTYNPWLRDMTSDIALYYLSGYYKINQQSAIAASMTYFSLGNIDFFSEEGKPNGNFKPNEMAFDLSYSMRLTEKLSASVTGRYVRSDLTQGQNVGTMATHAANAGAADVGFYFRDKVNITGYDEPAEYALGLQISNLGSKLSYSDDMKRDFLPANLRLGGRFTMDFDKFNRFSAMLDFNKLLIPTPTYNEDGSMNLHRDVNVLQGAIQSFSDAPNGFTEELQEIMVSLGLEYTYNKFLSVRAGYFYENAKKGDRQYITFGGGVKYNALRIDIAYLIPTAQPQNPLKNTLRLSLSFDI